MKAFITKIKLMPLGVKLSILFLFSLYAAVCISEPWIAILTITPLAAVTAAARLFKYAVEGK